MLRRVTSLADGLLNMPVLFSAMDHGRATSRARVHKQPGRTRLSIGIETGLWRNFDDQSAPISGLEGGRVFPGHTSVA